MWVRFPPAVSNRERSTIQHPTLESLAVIGLGAIGGSVAWRARLAGLPRVVGYTPDPDEAEAAKAAGAVTALAPSPEAALAGASFAVLAAPPTATLELIGQLARRLDPGAVLSDVASVKGCVMARARAAGLAACFAGAHPLAGTHGSGFAHAAPDLLRRCVVYVCRTGSGAGEEAARRVAGFWSGVLEATPVPVDAVEHDRQLAWTSHLPQAVAYALARVLADRGLAPSAFGTGARDTTRLAGSSPDLWIDIFLQNRDAVIAALDDAGARLDQLRALVRRRDETGLRALIAPAAAFRRSLDR
ncbi:MAG: prephenate dehydrogenase [Gemmatimonadales bacterium]